MICRILAFFSCDHNPDQVMRTGYAESYQLTNTAVLGFVDIPEIKRLITLNIFPMEISETWLHHECKIVHVIFKKLFVNSIHLGPSEKQYLICSKYIPEKEKYILVISNILYWDTNKNNFTLTAIICGNLAHICINMHVHTSLLNSPPQKRIGK